MNDSDVIKEFQRLANSASFHYADDSGREWPLGKADENEAMRLYHGYPHLQSEMDCIGNMQLWNFKKRANKPDNNQFSAWG